LKRPGDPVSGARVKITDEGSEKGSALDEHTDEIDLAAFETGAHHEDGRAVMSDVRG
jgi:hypothetical protein